MTEKKPGEDVQNNRYEIDHASLQRRPPRRMTDREHAIQTAMAFGLLVAICAAAAALAVLIR